MNRSGRFVELHRLGAEEGFLDVRRPDVNLGIPMGSLYRHLHLIDYEPFLPGLWVPRNTTTPFVVRCRLVLTYLDEDAVLTGAAGLHAHGVLNEEPTDIAALVGTDRHIRPRDGIRIHYASDLDAVRSVEWEGMPLARAPRCMRHYSADASYAEICHAMVTAMRLRRCTLRQLAEEAPPGLRFPGSGRYRQAVGELSGELNHSRYERFGRRLLRDSGLDVHSRPGPVLAGGHPVAEVDIPFYDVRYGVEVDGPHHLLPKQAARDRARDRMLWRDHGWGIDRYLWHELEKDPQRFVREVTLTLAKLRAGKRP